jgi:hypothetical protein
VVVKVPLKEKEPVLLVLLYIRYPTASATGDHVMVILLEDSTDADTPEGVLGGNGGGNSGNIGGGVSSSVPISHPEKPRATINKTIAVNFK